MSNPLEIVQALNGSQNGILKTSDKIKALAWSRVSTDMQEARNLSIPEQIKQI